MFCPRRSAAGWETLPRCSMDCFTACRMADWSSSWNPQVPWWTCRVTFSQRCSKFSLLPRYGRCVTKPRGSFATSRAMTVSWSIASTKMAMARYFPNSATRTSNRFSAIGIQLPTYRRSRAGCTSARGSGFWSMWTIPQRPWSPGCRRSPARTWICRCASCAAFRRSMCSISRTWASGPPWWFRWWSVASFGD